MCLLRSHQVYKGMQRIIPNLLVFTKVLVTDPLYLFIHFKTRCGRRWTCTNTPPLFIIYLPFWTIILYLFLYLFSLWSLKDEHYQNYFKKDASTSVDDIPTHLLPLASCYRRRWMISWNIRWSTASLYKQMVTLFLLSSWSAALSVCAECGACFCFFPLIFLWVFNKEW